MENSMKTIFFNTPHGKAILRCIQCGSCSGSCPYASQMSHGPREIFALIRDGEMEDVLASETPWFCSSCYQCMDRCPMEIPVTDIMYALKQMALQYNRIPAGSKMPDLYRSFAANMNRFGRITDPLVMAGYSLKHPVDALKAMPLAVRLALRGRLDIKPQQTLSKTNAVRQAEGRDLADKISKETDE